MLCHASIVLAIAGASFGFFLQGCSGPPGSSCDPCGASATYSEELTTEAGNSKRTIFTQGCPNHYSYCTGKAGLSGCGGVGQEGTITEAKEQNHVHEIPGSPLLASAPISVECEKGPIGVALNGVSIYSGWVSPSCNLLDVDDDDAEWISFDYCSGHATPDGDYHYHFPPSCLLDLVNTSNPTADGHSPQIGWSFDGFPIYGPLGRGGNTMGHTEEGCVGDSCLDECSGQEKEIPGLDKFKYRYYMSGPVSNLYALPSFPKPAASDYPFTIKCYKGCTWEDIAAGWGNCAGSARPGVSEDYVATTLPGYASLYDSPASEASALSCGADLRLEDDGSAHRVAAARTTLASPWVWIGAASAVGFLSVLLACRLLSPDAEEHVELAIERQDAAVANEVDVPADVVAEEAI